MVALEWYDERGTDQFWGRTSCCTTDGVQFGEEGDASRAYLSILAVELKKMNGNLNRIIELKKEEVLHVYILAAFCAFMIFIGLIFVMMNYGC